MGRSPCCDKVGLKKGPWTPEEDQKLLAYIEEHGHGNWRALPSKAGLQRCGKSCRLRWTNYLRPDIKRGKFSLQEEQTIIQLHALLGNRWSAIATHLPKRTDNEIKNYWNTHLKKRLTKMGIDPITHKPKNDALLTNDGQTNKNASNLSHMAQWESARLEAEARLVRQSKLIPTTVSNTTATAPHHQLVLNNTNNILHSNSATTHPSSSAAQTPRCIDQNPALRAWHGSGTYPKTISTSHDHPNSSGVGASGGGAVGAPHAIESPTSTLSFSENGAPINNPGAAAGSRTGAAAGAAGMIEFMADSTNTNSNNDTTAGDGGLIKEEGSQEFEWKTTFGNNNISSAPHQLAPPSDDHYSDVVENSLYSSGLHDMTLPAVMETPTWAAAAATTRAAAADGDCIIGSSSNTNTTTTNNNNNHHHSVGNFIENFTELLLSNSVDTSLSNSDGTAGGGGMGVSVGRASHDDDGGVNRGGDAGGSGVSCGDFYEDNKNYWNSILNLVNSSPSSSPLF